MRVYQAVGAGMPNGSGGMPGGMGDAPGGPTGGANPTTEAGVDDLD